MNRDAVWGAIDAERASLADLLDSLGEQEWEVPSLCAGWRIRDVAAHLTLAQIRPLPAVVAAVRARATSSAGWCTTARCVRPGGCRCFSTRRGCARWRAHAARRPA